MNVRNPGSNPGDRNPILLPRTKKRRKNQQYPGSDIYSPQWQLQRTRPNYYNYNLLTATSTELSTYLQQKRRYVGMNILSWLCKTAITLDSSGTSVDITQTGWWALYVARNVYYQPHRIVDIPATATELRLVEYLSLNLQNNNYTAYNRDESRHNADQLMWSCDRSIADELALESVSPSRRRCRGKLWWVCLRAQDHRIRGEKSSFRKWGKLTLLLIGQFPCWWLEKGAYRPRGELPVGSVRRRLDFSYLPVVGAQAICLFEILCIIET